MKMIRNTSGAESAKSLLIVLIGILVIGAELRSHNTAAGALSDFIRERSGALLRPTIFGQELTQPVAFACQWLRDVTRAAVLRFFTRSVVVLGDASMVPQADAP